MSNNTDLLEAALELCIVMSPISVTTRSSTVPVTEIGGGGEGVESKSQTSGSPYLLQERSPTARL